MQRGLFVLRLEEQQKLEVWLLLPFRAVMVRLAVWLSDGVVPTRPTQPLRKLDGEA